MTMSTREGELRSITAVFEHLALMELNGKPKQRAHEETSHLSIHTLTQMAAPGLCSKLKGLSNFSQSSKTQACGVWYGTRLQLGTRCWWKLRTNDSRVTGKQSTKRARPINLPPAWLSAKWIQPRFAVELPRISHFFCLARIKSSHLFFTTRARFAERLTPLRLPARFFFLPVVVLPPLPRTPLPRAVVVLPLLPRTPPPPNTFRFELAKDAFFLKQAVQNFDRVETASFVQRGLLHFLLALAFVITMVATGKLEFRWRR